MTDQDRSITLGGRVVGTGHPCFIIAEAGVNHNGSLDLALQLVDAAADAGADAVKFQLYQAKEQASKAAATAGYQKAATGSSSMLELAASYDLPWEKHHEIAAHCRARGIAYMASAFDPDAVDFLVALGGDSIKVGSGEITNFVLLEHMARTGLPVLLSTGMSTFSDVTQAVEVLRTGGSSPLALFQCSSNYPADPRTANLKVMRAYADTFNVPVGYSDHTVDDVTAIVAVALGASLLEKHFTIDRSLVGPDHAMSLDPAALLRFVQNVRTAELSMGDGRKELLPSEIATQKAARRSLVAARAIPAGTALSESDVTRKRPATGIDPREWPGVRGRRTRVDIAADEPITWDMLA